MFVICLPGLIDQIGMDGVDVGLSQEVRETFHATWRKDAAKYDFLEGIVKLRRQLAQIRRHAEPEHVAARALFIEPDLSERQLRRCATRLRGLRKRQINKGRRSRDVATVKPEGDDAVYVLVLRSGAAVRNGVSRNIRAA